MKHTKILWLGAVLLLPALADQASARSATASTGRSNRSSDASCFKFSVYDGSVGSRCSADFIVPLTTDHSGTKTISFTSKHTNENGAPAYCRAVANDPLGTAFSASGFVHIAPSADYVARTTGAVVVPHMGVFFADCILTDGARLNEFNYSD